jgi:hypothetical protein
VEAEFQRALVIVLVAGTLVFAAGALLLFAVFRRFAGAKPSFGLMAGLIAFIFLACAALFALSYMR